MSVLAVDDEWNQGRLTLADPAQAVKDAGWDSYSALAIGAGYSVLLQTRPTHPLQAEYFQRVLVFGGTERRGRYLGALRLTANTGGRMHVLIYRHLDETGAPSHVTFEDRYGAQTIRLSDVDFEGPPEKAAKQYLGTLSGEAYPYKYIAPLVLSEGEARKKLE